MKGKAINTLMISILFAVATTVLVYLNPNPDKLGQILAYVFYTIWGFSIVPAYIFVFQWLNKKSFDEGARIGTSLASMFGLGAFLLPIFIGPYFMVRYYQSAINQIKQENRLKELL